MLECTQLSRCIQVERCREERIKKGQASIECFCFIRVSNKYANVSTNASEIESHVKSLWAGINQQKIEITE